MGFVGKGIPVEHLMSVSGVLLAAVSWEVVGGFAISNGLCKTSQQNAFRRFGCCVWGVHTAFVQHCLGWEECLKLLPRALDVLRYLCHSVGALKPRVRCPK